MGWQKGALKDPWKTEEYTDDLHAEFIRLIADGTGIRTACRMLNIGWPNVYGALDASEERKQDYVRARSAKAEITVSDVVEIADRLNGAQNRNQIEAAKVKIASRQWQVDRDQRQQQLDNPSVSIGQAVILADQLPQIGGAIARLSKLGQASLGQASPEVAPAQQLTD